MIVINSSEGKQVLLPSDVSQIKLSNFVAYSKLMEAFDENADSNHIMTMCKALSELTGANIDEFLGLPLSQEDPACTKGLLQIFSHYSRLLGSFSPSLDFLAYRNHITYRGTEWRLPRAISGSMAMTTVTAAEAVEALEAGRIIQAMIDKDGDATGSALYTNFLFILAALLRRGDEVMPHDDVAREAFMKERVEYFADVTMDIALNVDFFLLRFLRRSSVTDIANGFLIPLVFEHLALGTLTLSGAHLMQQKQGPKKRSLALGGAL